jgi:hypothetical protein
MAGIRPRLQVLASMVKRFGEASLLPPYLAIFGQPTERHA